VQVAEHIARGAANGPALEVGRVWPKAELASIVAHDADVGAVEAARGFLFDLQCHLNLRRRVALFSAAITAFRIVRNALTGRIMLSSIEPWK
jgi:hypothetical protein